MDHVGNHLTLDGLDELDGELVHLVPEVLAGEPIDLDIGQLPERRRPGPLREGALAGGAAGAADGDQGERLTDGEAVISLWGQRLRGLARGAPARLREVTVDGLGDAQLARQCVERSDGTVGPGAHASFVGAFETLLDVVGLAQVRKHHGRGLAVDPAAGDEPVVGVALDADGLEAGHECLLYTTADAQSTTILRVPSGYSI